MTKFSTSLLLVGLSSETRTHARTHARHKAAANTATHTINLLLCSALPGHAGGVTEEDLRRAKTQLKANLMQQLGTFSYVCEVNHTSLSLPLSLRITLIRSIGFVTSRTVVDKNYWKC